MLNVGYSHTLCTVPQVTQQSSTAHPETKEFSAVIAVQGFAPACTLEVHRLKGWGEGGHLNPDQCHSSKWLCASANNVKQRTL